MAKLEVNHQEYLRKLIKECTRLDMNEEVEDSRPKEWFSGRIKQLNNLEKYAILDLKRANRAGFLSVGNFSIAKMAFHSAYEEVREQAKEKYTNALTGVEAV